MRASGAILAGLLLAAAPAALVPTAVSAQPGPGLTYAQPLSPQALMAVQERLRQVGAYPGRADGVWGPDSQAALERFQQARGLQVTGGLNQATAATLGLNPSELLAMRPDSRTGVDAAPAVATSATLSRGAVRNVQARLREYGAYRGPVDGAWGRGTQTAVERFQQSRGLQPTGQINPTTAQALGLDPNNLEVLPR